MTEQGQMPSAGRISRHFIGFIPGFLAVAAGINLSRGGTLHVPNGSFESPLTPYVSVNIDSWQKAAKPDWYVESGEFLWSYNVGIFKNDPTNSTDHIDNMDGNQAIWLFAVPEVALFQDHDSVDWSGLAPTNALDARFEPGKSYRLAVGVIATGGGMLQGATLEIGLYYRDSASNKVTVAAVSITNTTSIFTNNTHLIDFEVNVPMIKVGDAWADRHIGIQMLSTVSTNLQGGYWDLDNVRLTAIQEPVLLDPAWTNGQFQFTMRSEPGLAFEVLASEHPGLPISGWISRGYLTNAAGSATFTDTAATPAQQFYRARQLP